MTNAKNEPTLTDKAAADLGAAIRERFGPLPHRDPGTAGNRARHIASIHALADYLADHPDVPVPFLTRVHCTMPDTLQLAQLADHLGVEPWRNMFDIPQHIRIVVGDGRDQDAEIIVNVRKPSDERPL